MGDAKRRKQNDPNYGQPKVFQGELMTCVQCGFQQHSVPKIESGWLAVIADGDRSDLCPACAGLPAPKCLTHNRFYHEDYSACPWCELENRN